MSPGFFISLISPSQSVKAGSSAAVPSASAAFLFPEAAMVQMTVQAERSWVMVLKQLAENRLEALRPGTVEQLKLAGVLAK
jgi:hypothetical protein